MKPLLRFGPELACITFGMGTGGLFVLLSVIVGGQTLNTETLGVMGVGEIAAFFTLFLLGAGMCIANEEKKRKQKLEAEAAGEKARP